MLRIQPCLEWVRKISSHPCSLFSPCRCVRAVVGCGCAASRTIRLCQPSGGIALVPCVREFLHVLPSSLATSAPTLGRGPISVHCVVIAALRLFILRHISYVAI